MRFAPGLLPWFYWAYGRPTLLYWTDTRLVTVPLVASFFCFCVCIHDVLDETQDSMRTIIERHLGCSPIGGLIAYIGDVTFFYDDCLSYPIEAKLREIFAAHRIPPPNLVLTSARSPHNSKGSYLIVPRHFANPLRPTR